MGTKDMENPVHEPQVKNGEQLLQGSPEWGLSWLFSVCSDFVSLKHCSSAQQGIVESAIVKTIIQEHKGFINKGWINIIALIINAYPWFLFCCKVESNRN